MNKNINWGAVQFSRWYEWKRTFIFVPKKDINGKLILGKAWLRERYGSILGEHNKKTDMTPIHSVRERVYARNKDVFLQKLQDTMQ